LEAGEQCDTPRYLCPDDEHSLAQIISHCASSIIDREADRRRANLQIIKASEHHTRKNKQDKARNIIEAMMHAATRERPNSEKKPGGDNDRQNGNPIFNKELLDFAKRKCTIPRFIRKQKGRCDMSEAGAETDKTEHIVGVREAIEEQSLALSRKSSKSGPIYHQIH
jgi:hypothetical protein